MTLAGMLALGILLGAGGALVGVKVFEGDGEATAGTSAKAGRGSGKKQKKEAQARSTLSPEEASRVVGNGLGGYDLDEDLHYVKQLVMSAAEWAPDEALAEAMAIENPYQRKEVLTGLFNHWIRDDEEGALAALSEIDNVVLRRDLYREALRWLATTEPQSAVRLLQERNNVHDYQLWSRSFANWTRTDREGATKRALAIEHEGMRRHVLKGVGEQMADWHLPGALEWAEGLEGENATMAWMGILGGAARSNPATVVENLERLPEGRMREQVVGRAAGEWAERNPDAALEWAESLGEGEREVALGEIAETMLETDADRAEEILSMIPGGRQREEVLQQIARLRASTDVEEAVGWLESLPVEDRAEAWEGAAREWARVDPEAAASHARNTEDPMARSELVEAVSYSWAQRDPERAAEWAQSLEGPEQAGAVGRVVETWSREDPAAAGEFVSSSLEGDLQVHLARQVANRWVRNDATAATAWIDSLPGGQMRDGAVHTLVQSIESDYPGVAMQWAETITDERRRSQALRRLERYLPADQQ